MLILVISLNVMRMEVKLTQPHCTRMDFDRVRDHGCHDPRVQLHEYKAMMTYKHIMRIIISCSYDLRALSAVLSNAVYPGLINGEGVQVV